MQMFSAKILSDDECDVLASQETAHLSVFVQPARQMMTGTAYGKP